MISNILNSSVDYVSTTKDIRRESNKDVKQSVKSEETKKTENKTDRYERKFDKQERRMQVSYMINQAEQQTKNFETLISSIFSKQANKTGLVSMASKGNLKNFFQNLTVDAKTVAKAKQDISENGYYGVKQTSDRILSFAKAVAGDNPKKLEEMRKAVEKGFKHAERMWGGKLPEISQQTYDRVMETFDKWQGKEIPEPR